MSEKMKLIKYGNNFFYNANGIIKIDSKISKGKFGESWYFYIYFQGFKIGFTGIYENKVKEKLELFIQFLKSNNDNEEFDLRCDKYLKEEPI